MPSFYQSQQGRRIINTRLGGLRQQGCWNHVLRYDHCTPCPSFMNIRRGIPLFRYIGRQFVLLVSIIRRLTGKQRGHSLQHLQLNILSFQLLDFIKEIGTIQTLIFKYCSFFQPNVYNSRQINSIDRFRTQIQGSFFLLLRPNEVVVLDYEKYTLFWFWFH